MPETVEASQVLAERDVPFRQPEGTPSPADILTTRGPEVLAVVEKFWRLNDAGDYLREWCSRHPETFVANPAQALAEYADVPEEVARWELLRH